MTQNKKYLLKTEINTNSPDMSIFTEKDLDYIDPHNLKEIIISYTFKESKGDVELGDIMSNDMYIAIANILKLQYLLPVKYMKPIEGSYKYISQKCQINTKQSDKNTKQDISKANLTIEPLNPNFPQTISYTPINQMIPIGTIFTLHVEIPFRNSYRKMLTSSSIKCEINDIEGIIRNEADKEKINKCYKTKELTNIPTSTFNKRIAYGAIDIGSQLDCKFIVSYTDIHESISLFRFRRPKDNILEFIYYEHLCIDINYIIRLMKNKIAEKETLDKLQITKQQQTFLNNLLDEMII